MEGVKLWAMNGRPRYNEEQVHHSRKIKDPKESYLQFQIVTPMECKKDGELVFETESVQDTSKHDMYEKSAEELNELMHDHGIKFVRGMEEISKRSRQRREGTHPVDEL